KGVIDSAWVRPKSVGHARVEGARPGIAQQRVESMARALSFTFYLQGVVARCSHAVVGCDLLERSSIRKGWEPAADGISWDHAACTRRAQVFVRLANQNVRASCPRIACR